MSNTDLDFRLRVGIDLPYLEPIGSFFCHSSRYELILRMFRSVEFYVEYFCELHLGLRDKLGMRERMKDDVAFVLPSLLVPEISDEQPKGYFQSELCDPV